MKAVLYGLLIGATLALPFATLGALGLLPLVAAVVVVCKAWCVYTENVQEVAWREATRNSGANKEILLQK